MLVHQDPGGLGGSYQEQTEVDGGETVGPPKHEYLVSLGHDTYRYISGVGNEGGRDIQHVLGLDDEAPSGPDGARGHEGEVLSQR